MPNLREYPYNFIPTTQSPNAEAEFKNKSQNEMQTERTNKMYAPKDHRRACKEDLSIEIDDVNERENDGETMNTSSANCLTRPETTFTDLND